MNEHQNLLVKGLRALMLPLRVLAALYTGLCWLVLLLLFYFSGIVLWAGLALGAGGLLSLRGLSRLHPQSLLGQKIRLLPLRRRQAPTPPKKNG